MQRIARRGDGDACARGGGLSGEGSHGGFSSSSHARDVFDWPLLLLGSRCSWAATRTRARTARCVWSMVLVLIGVQHMASKQCGFSGGEGGLDGLSSLHSFEGFCVLR